MKFKRRGSRRERKKEKDTKANSRNEDILHIHSALGGLRNEFYLLWDLKVAILILIRSNGFENPTTGEVTPPSKQIPLVGK